ncbi:MAG: hypothetical protein RR317_05425, partial [Bilophila sp.]
MRAVDLSGQKFDTPHHGDLPFILFLSCVIVPSLLLEGCGMWRKSHENDAPHEFFAGACVGCL